MARKLKKELIPEFLKQRYKDSNLEMTESESFLYSALKPAYFLAILVFWFWKFTYIFNYQIDFIFHNFYLEKG